jgi:hypothetical protein
MQAARNVYFHLLLLQDAVHSYSGGLDNTLKMYDFISNTGVLSVALVHK